MPRVGVEPTFAEANTILSRARLPIPPPRLLAHSTVKDDIINHMAEAETYHSSIFLIETDRIKPNPYQPRREFDEDRLRDLADSIRQYGILQPLVVTRRELDRGAEGLAVEYELIAGERPQRAARQAGVNTVPAVIKTGEEDPRLKLELAIIENLQREDLSPIDRARAFKQLAEEFSLTHADIGKKVSRSREYVSNTIRLLLLPEVMINSLVSKEITEGHTRPLLMLMDRPEEQKTLYIDILTRKITVREAENLARKIAFERVRNKSYLTDPGIVNLEQKLTEQLGTRVEIQKKTIGGKVVIDFFTNDDLHQILDLLSQKKAKAAANETISETPNESPDEDLYSVKNFSL